MYEDFGARVDGRSVELSLFLPDNTVDPSQYEGDGDPRIHTLQVAGTFQPHLGTAAWDPVTAPALTPPAPPERRPLDGRPRRPARRPLPVQVRGLLPERRGPLVRRPLRPLHPRAGRERRVVVGGPRAAVDPIDTRLPLQDLVVYELMLDDFTAEYRGGAAPVDAVLDRIGHWRPSGSTPSS